MMVASTPEIRLLGGLEVRTAAGTALALPQSKKTRALLGYLVLSGRAHRRERLCSLFWDVTDDPRGALRWSLSRLRAVMNEASGARLVAERDTVGFERGSARVDAIAVKEALARGPNALSELPREDLSDLSRLFRGELLEGLDLPDFHDYQAWCVAEREQARRQRSLILRELVRRLASRPEEAIPVARELAQVDALDENAHATLVELLLAVGRSSEARQYHGSARRLLVSLGAPLKGTLDAALRDGVAARSPRAQGPSPPAEPFPPGRSARDYESVEPMTQSSAAIRFQGREEEIAGLLAVLSDLTRSGGARAVLCSGEPGIGKSRLALEFLAAARAGGATTAAARAFEAERTHPYAPWFDALRALSRNKKTAGKGNELIALLSRATDAQAASREQHFEAVARALFELASETAPIVLAFDDLQWCDEASTELLHYVLRARAKPPLLVLLTGRSGELMDNAAVLRTLRGLRRERKLTEIALGPLSQQAIHGIIGSLSSDVDRDAVLQRSAGNPLYAIELSRSLTLRPGADFPDSLRDVVRERIERLPPEAAEVLRWAAVLGRGFPVRRLDGLIPLSPGELVLSLSTLEQHRLLEVEPEGTYTFAHDLVRAVVYDDLSDPRRRLMHLCVARALEPRASEDEIAAADLAHHAGLAGDPALAARACVGAARRCLRLFANAEAHALCRRGRAHAEALPERERVPLVLELLQVSYAARSPEHAEVDAAELERLGERALDLGHLSHARLAFHLLSYLRWEGGAWSDAERYAREAERVSRSTDEGERMIALAEAGRCLAMLERDLVQAEALLLEAQALSRRLGREPGAVADAFGLLRLHEGRLDDAESLFQRSRGLARAEGDRAAEFQALEHLVQLELSRGRYDRITALAAELVSLAEKLREGSEMPFARALLALAAHASDGGPETTRSLEEAFKGLEHADAKHRLAYVLTRAACVDLERGAPALAITRAQKALECARLLDRPSEVALALGVLAMAAPLENDREGAREAREELSQLDLRRVGADVKQWLLTRGLFPSRGENT